MSKEPLIAVEIGTSRVRVLAADISDGKLIVSNIGEQANGGMKKGKFTDMNKVSQALKDALDRAENENDLVIRRVSLVFSGSEVHSFRNDGRIPVVNSKGDLGANIGNLEIQDALESARNTPLKPGREKLHSIVTKFATDQQRGIENPEGMFAYYLYSQVLVVYGQTNGMKTLRNLIDEMSLDIEGIFSGVICSAKAVLEPEQKKNGAIIIDMGGGTTDFAVYRDNTLILVDSIGVGGDHVTKDISTGLTITIEQAEQLKRKAGNAQVDLLSSVRNIPIPNESGFHSKVIKTAALHTIIKARLDELLRLIKERIEKKCSLHSLGSGVILTGGGACMPGITQLGNNIFNKPVSLGRPVDAVGLPGTVDPCQYASIIGCLQLAHENRSNAKFDNILWKAFRKIFGDNDE